MSIYSTLLYSADATSGLNTAYTVPAGATVVVRDIELYNSAGSATSFSVSRSVSGTIQSYIYVGQVGTGVNVWAQWQGRAVLNAGDVLEVSVSQTGLYFHISGYVLT